MGRPPRRPLMDRTSVPTTARQLPERHRGPTTSDGPARSMKSGTYESSRVMAGVVPCRSSDSAIRAVDRRRPCRRILDIAGLGSGTRAKLPRSTQAITELQAGHWVPAPKRLSDHLGEILNGALGPGDRTAATRP